MQASVKLLHYHYDCPFTTKSVSQSVSQWLPRVPESVFRSPYFHSKLTMAVAAMVARQMRENQERKEGPNSNWTEEERTLYELQQKSKSKLKVAGGKRLLQDIRYFCF